MALRLTAYLRADAYAQWLITFTTDRARSRSDARSHYKGVASEFGSNTPDIRSPVKTPTSPQRLCKINLPDGFVSGQVHFTLRRWGDFPATENYNHPKVIANLKAVVMLVTYEETGNGVLVDPGTREVVGFRGRTAREFLRWYFGNEGMQSEGVPN